MKKGGKLVERQKEVCVREHKMTILLIQNVKKSLKRVFSHVGNASI